jgi:hypothetical protein
MSNDKNKNTFKIIHVNRFKNNTTSNSNNVNNVSTNESIIRLQNLKEMEMIRYNNHIDWLYNMEAQQVSDLNYKIYRIGSLLAELKRYEYNILYEAYTNNLINIKQSHVDYFNRKWHCYEEKMKHINDDNYADMVAEISVNRYFIKEIILETYLNLPSAEEPSAAIADSPVGGILMEDIIIDDIINDPGLGMSPILMDDFDIKIRGKFSTTLSLLQPLVRPDDDM